MKIWARRLDDGRCRGQPRRTGLWAASMRVRVPRRELRPGPGPFMERRTVARSFTSCAADHSEVAPAPLSPLQIRSGFVLVGFTGFLLSVALTAVIMGGFVGSAILVVELRSSHDRLIDRQFMQLEWTTAVSTMPAQRELNRDETPRPSLINRRSRRCERLRQQSPSPRLTRNT